MSEYLFTLLIVGLAQQLQHDTKYPYPDALQHALHILSAQLLGRFPSGYTGLITLFQQPLESWWPQSAQIPDEIDLRFGLMWHGELDEQILDYLDEADLTSSSFGLSEITIVADNRLMRELLDQARHDYIQDPLAAETNYRTAREFVIRHPLTMPQEMNIALRQNPYRDLVQDMYLPAFEVHGWLLHENQYWQCPSCGPLYNSPNGNRQCVKPNWCALNCPGPASWQQHIPTPHLRVLKRGIHLRTMLPGLGEIQLYDYLETLRFQGSLAHVALWPGVDRYDLQIKFPSGEVWAVDVKDFRSPIALAQHIVSRRFYDLEDKLRFTRAYYIVPEFRAREDPGYIGLVRQTAPADVEVLSGDSFVRLVQNYLNEAR